MMGLGGLGLSSCGRGVGFDPGHLFASGDIGWVEPMIPGVTLFQDAAGTIPVTAPGQPVGLSKFTAGGQLGFVQATALNRPIYGRHPVGGVRNYVTRSSHTAAYPWNTSSTQNGVTATMVASGSIGDVAYADYALTGTASSSTSTPAIVLNTWASVAAGVGETWTCSVSHMLVAGAWPDGVLVGGRVGEYDAGGAFINATTGGSVPSAVASRGSVTRTLNQANLATVRGAITISGMSPGVTAFDGQVVRLFGWQLEKSAAATSLQNVFGPYDITEADVRSVNYLAHNGINQWMSTAPFAWGRDEATICAGLRKLSDASVGVVHEFSPDLGSNAGGFLILYPSSLTINAPLMGSKGTSLALAGDSATTFPAPRSDVLSLVSDISAPLLKQRVNGADRLSSTATQGSGTFGTHSLFAGSRGGVSLFFTGNRYPGAGINRLLNQTEMAQLEAWVNQRTGAF